MPLKAPESTQGLGAKHSLPIHSYTAHTPTHINAKAASEHPLQSH